MKLLVLSDLHLGVHGMERPCTDADVVILAGDIARVGAAVAWASGFDKPVLYVPGNHEFYGASIQSTRQELRRLCDGSHVQVLDRQAVELGGIRFLGATLWTDFRLDGEGEAQTRAMTEAQQFMRDFHVIRMDDSPTGPMFTPQNAADIFDGHVRWLDEELSRPHAGATVVITHHAPSRRSVHPRFTGSALNAGFVSDIEHLLGADRAALWIHGHTHDSFDYIVKGTRVICNPRGYAKDGINENPLFNPHLVVEIA